MLSLDEQIKYVEEELILDAKWTHSFSNTVGIFTPSCDKSYLEAILESLNRLKNLEK